MSSCAIDELFHLMSKHLKVQISHIDQVNDVDLGMYGDSLLIAACRYIYNDVALKLIEKGADVNFINNDHSTALIWSAYNNMHNVTNALIEESAELDVFDLDDDNALMISCGDNGIISSDIAIKLLDYGADFNIKNSRGTTAANLIELNKITKVKDHLRFLHLKNILESINLQNQIISGCFSNPVADLNLIDIVVDYLIS